MDYLKAVAERSNYSNLRRGSLAAETIAAQPHATPADLLAWTICKFKYFKHKEILVSQG